MQDWKTAFWTSENARCRANSPECTVNCDGIIWPTFAGSSHKANSLFARDWNTSIFIFNKKVFSQYAQDIINFSQHFFIYSKNFEGSASFLPSLLMRGSEYKHNDSCYAPISVCCPASCKGVNINAGNTTFEQLLCHLSSYAVNEFQRPDEIKLRCPFHLLCDTDKVHYSVRSSHPHHILSEKPRANTRGFSYSLCHSILDAFKQKPRCTLPRITFLRYFPTSWIIHP